MQRWLQRPTQNLLSTWQPSITISSTSGRTVPQRKASEYKKALSKGRRRPGSRVQETQRSKPLPDKEKGSSKQSLYESLDNETKQKSLKTGTISLAIGTDNQRVLTRQEEREVKIRKTLQRVQKNTGKYFNDEEEVGSDQGQESWIEDSQWKSFERRIIKLLEPGRTERTKDDKALWYKLTEAENQSVVALERELNFAFLDYKLEGKMGHKPSESTGLVADLRYPTEWYAKARTQQREIHLHVGPTNSGKTYNALKRLQESGNGFYAGPLRLLAHEVYSRFRANGVPCDLVTGDDVRYDENPDTKVSASTVEMVDTGREVEVAVIDEIQMMGADERGWAWTRAFLGANAKEVHLAGESRVIPLVRELTASMGDSLHIHRYDRLNPLKAMSRSLRGNLKNLRKGDCIVSFTIMGIHALKRQIELETGRRVAIVYGSLPPETRAQQAELFNDPENDYDFLVASDAIGMGLNLSIKRIIFETITKFNGLRREQLSIPQIKQIAGRAGRFRTAHDDKTKDVATGEEKNKPISIGLVTCLDESDLPVIQQALNSEPPPLRAAGIIPPAEYIEDFAARLPVGLPFEYILRRICDIARTHPRFKLCDIRDSLGLSRAIENVPNLSIAQRVNITASPASANDQRVVKVLRAFASAIAEHRYVTVADVLEIPLEILEKPLSPDREYLASLEALHKSLILFLWLSYRFPSTFVDRPMATQAKTLCEDKINRTLKEFSANPKLRARLSRIKREQQKLSSEPLSTDTGELSPITSEAKESSAETAGLPTAIPDWSEHPAEEHISFEEGQEQLSKADVWKSVVGSNGEESNKEIQVHGHEQAYSSTAAASG